MIVQLRVLRPSGEERAFEFRRSTIRVGAGSRNDLVLHSDHEVVQLLQLDVSASGFRVTVLSDMDVVRVLPPDATEPRDVESALILPAGTRILVGEHAPVTLIVDEFRRDDAVAWEALGELRPGSPRAIARELEDDARREVLALSYMILERDQPDALLDEVNDYLTRGASSIAGIQVALPAGEDGGWDRFQLFGVGDAWGALDAADIGRGPLRTELSQGRIVGMRDGSADLLLAPVTSNARMHALLVMRVEGAPRDALSTVRGHLRALHPVLLAFARRHQRNLRLTHLEEENRYFRERQRRHYLFKELVTESASMRRLHRRLGELVGTDTPVLLTGEAGTGKELLARALHHLGGRAAGMLVSQHCGTLDEDQLDFELFGSGAGAGHVGSRRGVFELAHGGTVFLDEVHALSPRLQARLHRLVVDGDVFRIGDSVARPVDVRIVAATHHDLSALAAEGRFRRDLAELFASNTLHLPPLRDRREDLGPLINTFLRQFAQRYRKGVASIEPATMDWLVKLRWPGNVRELLTVIERAVLQAAPHQTELGREDFELR